jgi:hypothetical protein
LKIFAKFFVEFKVSVSVTHNKAKFTYDVKMANKPQVMLIQQLQTLVRHPKSLEMLTSPKRKVQYCLTLTASVVWWLAYWPLVPEFAGSIPTDVKKSSACLPSEGK